MGWYCQWRKMCKMWRRKKFVEGKTRNVISGFFWQKGENSSTSCLQLPPWRDWWKHFLTPFIFNHTQHLSCLINWPPCHAGLDSDNQIQKHCHIWKNVKFFLMTRCQANGDDSLRAWKYVAWWGVFFFRFRVWFNLDFDGDDFKMGK